MIINIIGDLHMTSSNFDIYDSLFSERFLKKKGFLIFLGDIFHSSSVSLYFLHQVRELFRKLSENNSILIVNGNHDLISNKFSLITLLEPYVKAILIPSVLSLGAIKFQFIPYIPAKEFNIEIIKDSYVFSHLAIPYQKNEKLPFDFIPVDTFAAAKKVFNGHIHVNAEYKNIIFAGSLYPTSVKEINRDTYIFEFNTDTEEIKRIEVKTVKAVSLNSYKSDFDTNEYIVYFEGNMEEASKFQNVKKLVIKDNAEGINQQDLIERDMQSFYMELKDELENMIVLNKKEKHKKAIFDLLPEDVAKKLKIENYINFYDIYDKVFEKTKIQMKEGLK